MLAEASPDLHYQFERTGYFVRDSHAKDLSFNRTVTLRDTWAKIDNQNQ
jgi:glutaminyl-tRNA synthetase